MYRAACVNQVVVAEIVLSILLFFLAGYQNRWNGLESQFSSFKDTNSVPFSKQNQAKYQDTKRKKILTNIVIVLIIM